MKKLIFILVFAAVTAIAGVSAQPVANHSAEVAQDTEEGEILKLCKWYVSTLPSDDAEQTELRRAVAAEILKYATETTKFSLTITPASAKVLSTSSDLTMVYIAGEVIYCLEHNLAQSDAASFVSAMEGVINLYAQMPEHKVKALNKYLDMTPDKRTAAFEKLYNKG